MMHFGAQEQKPFEDKRVPFVHPSQHLYDFDT